MNPVREQRIESAAARAANYIVIAPEPGANDQYTSGSYSLGPAFCSISPTSSELEEIKKRINKKISSSEPVKIGDFGKAKPHRRVVLIKHLDGDFLALFVSLN